MKHKTPYIVLQFCIAAFFICLSFYEVTIICMSSMDYFDLFEEKVLVFDMPKEGRTKSIIRDMFKKYNNDISRVRVFLSDYFKRVFETSPHEYYRASVRNLYLRFYCLSFQENGCRLNDTIISTVFQTYKSYMSDLENNISFDKYRSESLFFHHSLLFAPNFIIKYIQDKILVDIGADCGDSTYVLRQYSRHPIYAFEPSLKNAGKMVEYLSKNGVESSEYVLINKGLGDEISKLNYSDVGKGFNKLTGKGESIAIISTLDSEFKNRTVKIGLLKGDTEGFGYKIIKGGENIIKEDRPIITFAVYHNFDEFFNIPLFLDKNIGNYSYTYSLSKDAILDINEVILLAYPNEIIENDYSYHQTIV